MASTENSLKMMSHSKFSILALLLAFCSYPISSQDGIVIDRLDHLVLTVRSIDVSIAFYSEVLGMEAVTFGDQGRKALTFGNSKINLHEYGNEFEPHALEPTPGSADLCFITNTPLSQVISVLNSKGVPVEEGPVQRTGATGKIVSVYVRDPDQNLVEVSNYLEKENEEERK